MKSSNINLLGSHLADKNITFIAQDLLALDVAEKIAEIFGTPTEFIAEARALITRFENEIDAKIISDARLMADHLKNHEGRGNERTFADTPLTYVLHFPRRVAPAVVEAPAVEETPAPVSELKKRAFVVEVDGQIIAVRETARGDYGVAMGFKVPKGWRVNSFHRNSDLAVSYYGKGLQSGPAHAVLPTREIFTKAELKSAKASAKAYKKTV